MKIINCQILNWKEGRQGTGYLKLPLRKGSLYDIYLLKFPEGSNVPEHTDPVWGINHVRLNIILRHATKGGRFVCKNTILNTNRMKLFRPDIEKHSVTTVEKGERFVLSLGFGLPSWNKSNH